MKVTLRQPEAVFQPVTVTITFENEDELETFRSMIGHDQSVPELVFPNNSDHRRILASTMTNIYKVLR